MAPNPKHRSGNYLSQLRTATDTCVRHGPRSRTSGKGRATLGLSRDHIPPALVYPTLQCGVALESKIRSVAFFATRHAGRLGWDISAITTLYPTLYPTHRLTCNTSPAKCVQMLWTVAPPTANDPDSGLGYTIQTTPQIPSHNSDTQSWVMQCKFEAVESFCLQPSLLQKTPSQYRSEPPHRVQRVGSRK